MGDYEQTTTVSADADALFRYLSDVNNLPDYFAAMKSAEPAGGDAVHTVAEVDGTEREGEAWFTADEEARAIRWGSQGPKPLQRRARGNRGRSPVRRSPCGCTPSTPTTRASSRGSPRPSTTSSATSRPARTRRPGRRRRPPGPSAPLDRPVRPEPGHDQRLRYVRCTCEPPVPPTVTMADGPPGAQGRAGGRAGRGEGGAPRGTSTSTIRVPSGSAIHISAGPRVRGAAPGRRARPARGARRRGRAPAARAPPGPGR